MKKGIAILSSILLLSFGYSMNSEVFALTPIQEKENIIQDLEILKDNPDINKKTKKNIESAIKYIKKSLDEKFWKDESTVNLKYGKKVLSEDQKEIKKLDKILKEKNESDLIKDEILRINLRITEIDKLLVENSIMIAQDVMMSDKGIKKLSEAINEFEQGSELLEVDNYRMASTKFVKAMDQIKKSLKDPNIKKVEMVELEGTGDFNFDGTTDVYLKVINPSKSNKPKQVEIKITGECVNGKIHDDAAMKIGFSTQSRLSTEFFDEEFKATNKWFKKHDPDKKINPVVISSVSEYFSFPTSGDDLIQKNPENEKGSFDFISSIPILGEQSGWEGKFEFKGEPGDYHLNFWLPLTEPTNLGDSCNFVSSFSIPTTINP